MELKLRLQRVLQILEDSERSGAMSELEKDMVLAELREAYSEVKFGAVLDGSVAPVLPTPEPEPVAEDDEPEVEEEEPEMEVEIIFNEDDDEEEVESEELREESEIETPIETPAEIETPSAAEPEVEDSAVVEAPEEVVVYEAPAEEETEVEEQPIVEEKVEEPAVPEPIVEEKVEKTADVDELSTLHSPLSTPTHSAILSLYEEGTVTTIGEQFHEAPSVADTIACPKGVVEASAIASLRDAIGVADKFMLVRELFNGDNEAYESAITALDSQPSLDDCVIYIAENYTWSPNSQATKLVMELLNRKYN